MNIIDLTVTQSGGGGGVADTHNKGWFETPEALKQAYPTANNGDFAIVGTTDTIWVWDKDTTSWVDTGSGGLVQSVNGKTGEVVLNASDIGVLSATNNDLGLVKPDNKTIIVDNNGTISSISDISIVTFTNSTSSKTFDEIKNDVSANKIIYGLYKQNSHYTGLQLIELDDDIAIFQCVTETAKILTISINNTNDVTIETNKNLMLTSGAAMSGELHMGSNKITDVATPTSPEDAANKFYVDAETTARQNADKVLQNNIDTEKTERKAADNSLQDKLTEETTAREGADNNIKASITAEINERKSEDTKLDDKIEAEIINRTSIDTQLQNNINAESIARANANSILQTNIEAKQDKLTSDNAGENITITVVDGVLKINSTGTTGAATWGQISGTLSEQTDLQNALNAKVSNIEKGTPEGVATLGADGRIPLNQLKVIDNITLADTTTFSSNYIVGNYATITELDKKAANDAVVHLTGNESIAGTKTFTDNAKIGSTEKTANLDIAGNLNIQGNIVQNGQAYETHAEKVYTTNDYIILRDGAEAGLLAGEYSGFTVVKYDGENNGNLVIDSTGTARVGDARNEQPLLTRSEATDMSDGLPLVWNAEGVKAITSDAYPSKQYIKEHYIDIDSNDQTINGKKIFAKELEANSLYIYPGGTGDAILTFGGNEKAVIQKDGQAVLTMTANGETTIASGHTGNSIYLRPKGANNTNGQVEITNDGKVKASEFIGSIAEATKATQDGDGNVISTTYAKAGTTVNLTGDQTVTGLKTFENDLTTASLVLTNEIFTINKNTETIIRNTSTGETVIANMKNSTNGLYLRPNGTDESEGQVVINKDGTIDGIVTKAKQDSEGNTINTTYIKDISVTDTTLTFTKGDGTTGTATTQDNKVQSVVSAGNAKYPIHLNNGTAATTNTTLIDTSIYANPSTNTIGSDIISVASKVNIAYNSNTVALDFNFV